MACTERGVPPDGWYIINARWLNHWRLFLQGKRKRPGHIDNNRLFKEGNLELGLREGLKVARDYRGLYSTVWTLLYSYYGGGPVIRSPTLNIYEAQIGGPAGQKGQNKTQGRKQSEERAKTPHVGSHKKKQEKERRDKPKQHSSRSKSR